MRLVINEKQEAIIRNELLKEAVGFGFSLETLKKIRSFKGKYEYCQRFLGRHVGKGTARVVFQYDDNMVLKLALNNKGLAQNEEEHYKLSDSFANVFPKLYDNLSDEEDYTFIMTEYVIPATNNDFEACFGVDFKTFCNVITTWESWKGNNLRRRYLSTVLSNEDMEAITQNDEWIDFKDYFMNYDIEGIGDLFRISSYGMTNRNGKPEIVILDAGLSNEIYNTYYQRKNSFESINLGKNTLSESIKIHKGEKRKKSNHASKMAG